MTDFRSNIRGGASIAFTIVSVSGGLSGHGPETEPGIDPAAVVTEQREYIEDLMAAVKTAMDAATHSPDELQKTVKLPKYENWRPYDAWLPMNIERIWAFYHMGW